MGKRLGTSFLGIPLYILTGAALFVLFSAIYDFIVFDRSVMRYGLLFSSIIILVVLVSLHFVKLSFISRQAKRQMGA